jgi:citrate lyase subunit beta/citryl-CoA lyase
MPRLRRSELVTPATSEKMLKKAAQSPADIVIIDLEDAVTPDRKAEARQDAIAALTGLEWAGPARAVRINAPGQGQSLADLAALVPAAGSHLDLVVIPKVTSPRQVWWVATTLAELEHQAGLSRPIGIEVVIEDVAAMAELPAIARCSRRIEALSFGPGDFSASQGVDLRAAGNDRRDLYPGDVWHYVRSAMVIAARSAGIAAVDGAYAGLADPDGYRRECVMSRTLGFDGKVAVHPSQTDIANEEYAPSPDQVAAARNMIAAHEEAARSGAGAATHDGKLIDAATLRSAQRIAGQAERSAP